MKSSTMELRAIVGGIFSSLSNRAENTLELCWVAEVEEKETVLVY